MSEFEGVNIREVWDYRLSSAVPQIYTRGGTWVVQIWAKSSPDYDPSKPETMAKPIEEHDTGIKAEAGDERDNEKLKTCYEWLLTRRDDYALENIEEIKPVVATINAATAKLAELQSGLTRAQVSEKIGVKH